jgi:hypothetical protein
MRGTHPAPHIPGLRRAAPAVGTLIPGVFARLGLAEPFARWRAVGEWDAIVGESLARQARPVRVQGSTLIVETNDPFGLSHFKLGLLERIREHLGSDAIRDIRFEHVRTQEARP